MSQQFQTVIVGGGLGGLVCANLLAKKGLSVCLIERKSYPFHRVCGEYVSNEVRSFLEINGLFPGHLEVPEINTFNLTSINGKLASSKLDLGGFGVSRYSFDHFLAERAISNGVTVMCGDLVEDISFKDEKFLIRTKSGIAVNAEFVVGSFGKRSNLDKKLKRKFLNHPSPYIGVKYHVQFDMPPNEISLHNFKGGYCGISKIENDKVNLCYLSERKNLKESDNIRDMEQKILHRNPYLKKIWQEGRFLFDDPVVINEINFESKGSVENHILMVGDSAGMIAPLCGNGMAIAIHSAKIAAEELVQYYNSKTKSRNTVESRYRQRWQDNFSTRLKVGRNLQSLFGSVLLSNLSVSLLKNANPLGQFLIGKTHGTPI